MRPLRYVLPLLLAVPSRPLTAQTPDEPHLTLTLFAGAVTGHDLWDIKAQPLCVVQKVGATFPCVTPPEYDTLHFTRKVASSIVAGASATYFKSPHIGFQGEAYYLGLPFEDSCAPVAPYQPDAESKNQQLCDNFVGAAPSIGAIGFYGSVVLRVSAMHAISPYVRVGGGVVAYSGGTEQASGNFALNGTVYSRVIIVDDKPKTTSLSLQLATGFTSRLSPAYQFRFEVRDAVVPLRRVTGPADALGRAPAETKTYHHIALTLGLDIVLERKRGRRY